MLHNGYYFLWELRAKNKEGMFISFEKSQELQIYWEEFEIQKICVFKYTILKESNVCITTYIKLVHW